MISIAGAAHRRYTFPAPLDVAFRFNANLDRMLGLLPFIAVVAAPAPARRRLCYRATEAGLYKVRLYCSVAAEVDRISHEIRIHPLEDPARDAAGVWSMSGRGRYESTIRFRPEGDATRIEYMLKLSATIPTPDSLRLLPEAVVNARANRRFRRRLDEIVATFVQRSIAEYRAGCATEASYNGTAPASRGRRDAR